jgi:hypothetical protein
VRKILKHIVEETIRPPPLLPDEAPEVTYVPATDFASTMVEFQAKIKINSAGVVCVQNMVIPTYF